MGCIEEASYAVSGGWLVTRVRRYVNGVLALESETSARVA